MADSSTSLPLIRPELLAPAGDAQAMRAAIANGADAVYFGLEDFNARRRAENFKLADLPNILDHLHRFNVRGYITFNTLVFSDEWPRAREFLAGIIRSGADGVIVQDLGLIPLIRQLSPDFPIHASTQMTQTHPAGLAWLRELGVWRVVLARELSLEQIRQIARANPMELEVFIHGALCISYSGQCLASHTLLGRSANRGQCAQACRLPYQLVEDGQPVETDEHRYLLSPKDLAAYELIGELVAAGVRAFKIEGRLKDARYVATATRLYRQAIDAALKREPFHITRRQQQQITQCFSRGFSVGFLRGRHHQQLMSARSPKTRGQFVGTVVERTPQGIRVELGDATIPVSQLIQPGDGVVFDEGRPDLDEQGARVYSVERISSATANRPPIVEFTFGRHDLDLRAIHVASRVWKTDDPAMRREIESSYARIETVHRIPIHVRVDAAVGEVLRISARDDAGHTVVASSSHVMEAARKHPLHTALLIEQLGRLVDTPFELAKMELVGPQGNVDSSPIMAPKSTLNELRREIIEKLLAARRVTYPVATENPSLATEPPPSHPHTEVTKCHVLIRHREQFEAILRWRDAISEQACQFGCVYSECDDPLRLAELARLAYEHAVEFAPATLRITHIGDERWLDGIAELQPLTVLIRNLSAWRILRERLPQTTFVADQSLNVANGWAASLLRRSGFARITPACELSESQLNALTQQNASTNWELILQQHVPMFHLAHCPIAHCVSHAEDCHRCGHPCRSHDFALRDRNGVDHPLQTDVAGRTTIFSSSTKTLLSPRVLQQQGVHHWRIELLNETAAQSLLRLRQGFAFLTDFQEQPR